MTRSQFCGVYDKGTAEATPLIRTLTPHLEPFLEPALTGGWFSHLVIETGIEPVTHRLKSIALPNELHQCSRDSRNRTSVYST